MKVEKKDIEKSQIELVVELSLEEFRPYIMKGAEKISSEIKIDGFRSGKVPFEVLKQKVGEMAILEESARIAINKTIGKAIEDNIKGDPVGQPRVDIIKLAPDNPLEYKVIVVLLPKIEVLEYKNFKINKPEVEYDEKELERTMIELQEMRVKEVIADREIKSGDKVLISIKMFQDNVPVEGGQAQETAVIIGKDYIIPGFDKKLEGSKKGEIKDFSLPYPKDHYMKNLAGKMVEFKVEIKEVYEREMPVLNDEFAVGFGMKKLQELKENIKKNIIEQKEKEASVQLEKEMLDKLIEKNKFGEIPAILMEHEVETMIAELEHTITSRGAKFDEYLSSISKSIEQLKIDLMPDAVKRVKISLLLKEIAEIEKIKISDEEYKKHQDDMRKAYAGNKDAEEKIKTPEYKRYAINMLTSQKIVRKLTEWNIG